MVSSFGLAAFVKEKVKKLLDSGEPEWKRKQEQGPRLHFNLWAYANPRKAPPAESLLEKERAPPARPIPLELPRYSPNPVPRPLSEERMRQLREQIVRLRKPSDVSDSLFSHFNVRVQTNVELEDFVPRGHFEQRPFLFDSDLTSVLKELEVENEDAFREVLRMPPLQGHTKPRLAYSRNFFASLEDLSRYWDDSKDDYFDVEVEAQGDEASPGRRPMYKGHRLGNAAQTPPQTRISTARNFTKMFTHKFNCRDADVGARERLKIKDILIPAPAVMYTFNICRVPSDRNLAKARLLEGPLLSVYCRPEAIWRPTTRATLLAEGRPENEVGDVVGEEFDFLRELGGLLFLAEQRAREGKGDKDAYWKQETADWWWAYRPRWGGGSTKWGQLPSEVFEHDDPSLSPAERELLRVKREEEDAAAATPTATTAPPPSNDSNVTESAETPAKKRTRFGLTSKSSDREEAAAAAAAAAPPAAAEFCDGKRVVAMSAAKKRTYQDWQAVRPNSSPWDAKLIYKGVGRPRPGRDDDSGRQFDHVFQIGCVGHHLILNKMTVSKRYLHWLSTGTTPPAGERSGAEEDAEVDMEEVIHIQRSKWFDLFKVSHRKDFLIGMWRIMCWLNREDVPRAEYERMDKLRQAGA